ncbi:hypothetical protein E5A76_17695 [Photobacterium sp. CAIM 1937]|nr:hypothetical protein [Vibrio parahaemolyticus]MZG58267.1 hypothetical protein [Photobacterium lucens]MZG81544.1 hypothetical protein [Photobacterium lucens]
MNATQPPKVANKVEKPSTVDAISEDVAEKTANFESLISDEIVNTEDERYVAEEDIEGNPLLHGNRGYHASQPIITEINLLTGEDLWHYKPNLLDKVKKEQGIPMLPIESIVEINDELLTDLKVGDSLVFTMPNGAEQQIVIAKINKISDKVTAWDLQNTQRQDIGKITQINDLTEGSFITDSKDEYHLRTVKNKGWLTSKKQLISNNNEAVYRNSEAYSDLIK